MQQTPSILGLHLRYRIWIAEMNADITIIRIFDDYLSHLHSEADKAHVKSITENFKKQFGILRKQIDELKHEMHLVKMKLAANAREGKSIDRKSYKDDSHADLKKHYATYRKLFSKMKTEFGLIKCNWLS